ncbi:MAG: DNA polymerase III subunit chi [Chelatococcus sp.]|uniref:DNA polymerase III subunit chi n=1 Tax=unclassified Chelatococcus TaxID=2638111 RepID=UPI001BCBDE0E|nr:DNA polymerase III subunit chi [Chelatococcus sp.]MBS7738779.1 DNA polymerase III subunit chi [Chelatococcus sp. HY11]CAH1673797.1 DNA polymerase III chi subunit [Hyphomicrobiales bacterium]MBX3539878.1 DNA polymerase III subunit chi [Chelatococcus sp.]MBX3543183.1 DNA polymerase III subunit chi [Chelatococcus sp.]MCO5076690.1 DNA polymerase III subunit chi [Chelatococcus sp.]
MTEVLFYHLQRQPLEAVLPTLVEKSLERGWRVAIESPERERLAALDDHLWTYREESFLPHGTEADPDASSQPVVLTTSPDNPNDASVRFLVDGATLSVEAARYDRIVVLFDGNDDEALAEARGQWRVAREQGFDVTYWQQDERGRWQKKA